MSYGPQHVTSQIISDLAEITLIAEEDLREIVERPIIITGASGFIGTWLVLSWVAARKKFNGNGRLLITSRNPESLLPLIHEIDEDCPVVTISSEIDEFTIPVEFENGVLIHAATPASAAFNSSNPAGMLDVIISGQRQILNEAVRMNCRVLFLSSGAVYGRQPLDQTHVSESWEGAPNIGEVSSAYHEGKRVAELMGNIAAESQGLHFTSARLFAFVAPFLPLGTHFAAGNFIRDAVTTGRIEILSGGGSQRSYLYATDMCAQLWGLAQRGKLAQAYNLGSDVEITIRDLAEHVVSTVNPDASIVIRGTDSKDNVSRYVPSVERMRSEIGARQTVSLSEALTRTNNWLKETGQEFNER